MENKRVIELMRASIDYAEQKKYNYSAYGGFSENAETEIEAYTLAIAALELQGEAEKREPCEYCKGEKPIRNDGKKGFYAENQGNKLYVQYTRSDGFHDYGFIDADHCIRCGRKLEVQQCQG